MCHLYSFFFFSSRRRHTRFDCDWSSDVCSSDLEVVNADDPAWLRLPHRHRRVTFGEREGSDVSARKVVVDGIGARFDLITPTGSAAARLPLLGRFNVTNALGVAACAWGMAGPSRPTAGRPPPHPP